MTIRFIEYLDAAVVFAFSIPNEPTLRRVASIG